MPPVRIKKKRPPPGPAPRAKGTGLGLGELLARAAALPAPPGLSAEDLAADRRARAWLRRLADSGGHAAAGGDRQPARAPSAVGRRKPR
jgi:hypothetical protein